jgi:Rod binding domain-containing protein
MDRLSGYARLNDATLHPRDPAAAARDKAQRTARQFEELFVRSMVSTMRQTAGTGDEGGGLFGSGPGSDTYTDWFDQHLANHMTASCRIGIADAIMREFERNHEIPGPPPAAPRPHLLAAIARQGVVDESG